MMTANLVNLTPHDIHLVGGEADTLLNTYPASGDVARCTVDTKSAGKLDGYIPLVKRTYGEVIGLPEPKDNTYYIVSGLVGSALNGARTDILLVDDLVRNDKGQIIGCRAFATA